MTNLNSDDITLQGRRDVWKYYALIVNKKYKGDKLSMSIRIENFLSRANQYMKQTSASPLFNQVLTNRYQNFYLWLVLLMEIWKKGSENACDKTGKQQRLIVLPGYCLVKSR
ncbi:MAG: hypothetical protein WDO71_08490 [Bacteroidota bacterium]